ncbi:hypothetical protein FAVG1_09425 [Fusarium avenaceum]|nr:hypothetical protein FAVG1_09425 [Fusarium avenaceum]
MPSPNEKQKETQEESRKEETSTKAEESPSKQPESTVDIKEDDTPESARQYACKECCPACRYPELFEKQNEK